MTLRMVLRFRLSKQPLRFLLLVGMGGFCLGPTFGIEKTKEVPVAAAKGVPPIIVSPSRVELNEKAKDEQIRISGYLPDPLIPVPSKDKGETGNASIVMALNAFNSRTVRHDSSALAEFAAENPDSRWTPSILLNLGILKYRNGYFSEALDFWKQCWEHSKDAKDTNGKLIADRAVAELASMLARIGRQTELEKLLGEVEGRTFNISAEQRLNRARDGFWHMKNKPGAAFMCGPYALKAVGQSLGGWNKAKSSELLQGVQSTNKGFSVQELAELGNQRGVPVAAMRRSLDAPIVVPSVVHWKVGHFGAIVSQKGDSYYIVDPTFQNNTWMSEDAINREASGIFLISSEISPPRGWSGIPKSELAATFGKGHSGSTDEDETSDCSEQTGDDCGGGAIVGEQAGIAR